MSNRNAPSTPSSARSLSRKAVTVSYQQEEDRLQTSSWLTADS
jgi:hypothetical protein